MRIRKGGWVVAIMPEALLNAIDSYIAYSCSGQEMKCPRLIK